MRIQCASTLQGEKKGRQITAAVWVTCSGLRTKTKSGDTVEDFWKFVVFVSTLWTHFSQNNKNRLSLWEQCAHSKWLCKDGEKYCCSRWYTSDFRTLTATQTMQGNKQRWTAWLSSPTRLKDYKKKTARSSLVISYVNPLLPASPGGGPRSEPGSSDSSLRTTSSGMLVFHLNFD